MNSYINATRPPAFCPGCTHEMITKSLDKTFVNMGLAPEKIVIVTDIGCSGLFDTFFNVHALHGVHGRALTYAMGLKMSDPSLNVIVTMGDGGLGIGGAHVLSACRKNLDITLIILNNFNFGMTGGQYSVTTPEDAVVGSEFLNQAEVPIDICKIAKAAGATYVSRYSGMDPQLAAEFERAIRHKGFSVVETFEICTGRYTKRNKLTFRSIDEMILSFPREGGPVPENERAEYGERYRALAAKQTQFPEPLIIEKQFEPKEYRRWEIIILGSAGMRIITAGDIICHAGIAAGFHATIKNDYNITVLRGQSVSEILLDPDAIGYTGLESPHVVLALSDEGVTRRKKIFAGLSPDAFVLKEKSVTLPDTLAQVEEIDFKALKIKKPDWALAALGILAKKELVLTTDQLVSAMKSRFSPKVFALAQETLGQLA
ncbi:thiamine pyrophosphate-dependent enzyme [uncultured Desulfobacter sp.]|uniref:thiamine pyrophosphate-dependent enzyme n=1 Tax=uncultured Desulfobacter sp. TaxID=240139 RepID=UPI002AAC00EB|nr:thiamine pyrophosphate-dependent enzyme [uncultured Desulfobacter sp.]